MSTPTKITPTPPLTFIVKPWDQLTTNELYEFLKLRTGIFIVEQDCNYHDLDGKDDKALHVMGYVINPTTGKQEMAVYSRVFGKGDYFDKNSCVGRVVCSADWRGYGYGDLLLDKALEVLAENFTMPVSISAQLYLKKYYEKHGFKQVSEQYLEDGLPHIEMLLEEKDLTGDNQKFIGQCKYDSSEATAVAAPAEATVFTVE